MRPSVLPAWGLFYFYFLRYLAQNLLTGEGVGAHNHQNSEKEAWRLCPLHKDDRKKRE